MASRDDLNAEVNRAAHEILRLVYGRRRHVVENTTDARHILADMIDRIVVSVHDQVRADIANVIEDHGYPFLAEVVRRRSAHDQLRIQIWRSPPRKPSK